MARVLLVAFLYALALAPGALLHAQNIPGLTQNPTVTLNPAHPRPFELVTASITMPGQEISTFDIAWFLDGAPVLEGTGATTYSWKTKDVGEQQSLSVIARSPSGETSATQAKINPVRLELAWEARTYTPPLYEGRALYTAGARIALEAHIETKDATGTLLQRDNLVYTWRRNGSAIPNASGRGKHSLITDGPKFYGSDTLSVEVKDLEGTIIGVAGAYIETREPVLSLYAWSPLLGRTLYRAFIPSENTLGNTQTLYAEPFFINSLSAQDPLLAYTWLVNGTRITIDPKTPQIVSLASDEARSALVSLSVTHETALLQEARGSWRFSLPENSLGIFGL